MSHSGVVIDDDKRVVGIGDDMRVVAVVVVYGELWGDRKDFRGT